MAIQILLFAGILCSLWIIEHSFSNKSFNDKLKHAYCNLLFILAVLPVQLLISLVAVLISKWVAEHHWGLLYLIPLSKNIYLKYLFGFLILDFLDYIYHIMMHKTTMLWKFHQVHHADTFVDVSTTLREHPGETFVRVCFLCLWIFLSGASLGLLIIRQMAQTIANIIAHTELKLPSRTEKMLGLVFVTPHIHSIHHHDKMPYTDSNYGDVLSIWDRIFGTYKVMDRSEICHGLDVISPEEDSSFVSLISIPFTKIKV